MPGGTVQQAAANALFLQYAPPPPTSGVICLVDSGVDPNPDTEPILAGSHALSPGTNTNDELAALDPPLGGHPGAHGTYMAMIAAAPANGWGMVGLAPTSVHVYNLKVLAAGHTTFPFSEYASAVNYCESLSSSLPIAVVDLSLEADTQSNESERESLKNSVMSANQHGIGIVAAVGDEGGQVRAPADEDGVLGVGASNANSGGLGMTCPFSNRGVGLDVLAPGCDSQGGIEVAYIDDGAPAWTESTSDAATIVSAVEASMRAYSPTLSYSQIQECITSTTVNEGNLDVAAAFNACGLGEIVNEGMAAYHVANISDVVAASPSPAPRGASNGTNASEQARLTARWMRRTKKGVRTSAYGQSGPVTGRLITPSGLPISGAVLDVDEIPADQGARAIALPSVATNATGNWTLTLPRDAPSGVLRVEYRSHLGDATPAARATLTLRVHAGIALSIRPRVTSVGHRIMFSGVLHGSPLPPDGKQLVLEASSGGEWIQFDTIDTAAHGRYRASYRFKLPGPVTYEFRVVSPHESDFPFLVGTSNVVVVHER
jgi:hypothetical protein